MPNYTCIHTCFNTYMLYTYLPLSKYSAWLRSTMASWSSFFATLNASLYIYIYIYIYVYICRERERDRQRESYSSNQ